LAQTSRIKSSQWVFPEVQIPAEIEWSSMRKVNVLKDGRLLGRPEFSERLDAEIEALRKVARDYSQFEERLTQLEHRWAAATMSRSIEPQERSIQFQARGIEPQPQESQARGIESQERGLEPQRQSRQLQLLVLDASRGRAPQDEDGTFVWLRAKNEESHRAARREVSALTERATNCRGYAIGRGPQCPLEYVDRMIAGTVLISPSKGTWPVPDIKVVTEANVSQIRIEKSLVFEEAVKARLEGKRVVAVNAASAFHTGGGFQTGGRHALEEAMCVQSTLYASLKEAESHAEKVGVCAERHVRPAQKRYGENWLQHIPDDGVVLSPYVEVFRGGTNDGYAFEDAVVVLDAVVSVAMPNCNDRMSDSPVDAHPEPQEYKAQLTRKWRAVLTAAANYTQADTLIVPDAGCGVFRNPPKEVGVAFGQVLRDEFPNRFNEIIIAFPGGRNGEEFAEHACATFQGTLTQS